MAGSNPRSAASRSGRPHWMSSIPAMAKGPSHRLDHRVRIGQHRDAVPLEGRLDLACVPPQVLVIPQRGEGAVPGADPGHLFDAARKKRHGVRDEIPGEDEQFRLQHHDLVDVPPHVVTGHVDAGMDVGELNNTQRSAEGQGELLDAVRLARVRSAVPGEEHRGRRDAAHPDLQETAPAKVHRGSGPPGWPGDVSAKRPGVPVRRRFASTGGAGPKTASRSSRWPRGRRGRPGR